MMATALPVDEGAVDVRAIAERMRQGLPPADVQEYLWRVRIEAEGIPDVVVSDVDPRQYDRKQTANMPAISAFEPVTRPELLPEDTWKNALLADFAELRQLLARWQELGPPEDPASSLATTSLRTEVPRMNDEEGWLSFFFGSRTDPCSTDESSEAIERGSLSSDEDDEDQDPGQLRSTHGTPPHLRLLLQFDQVLTRRLLSYHTEWLETVETLSRARAVWIYALLARLDKPVHAEVAAVIRQLLRRSWGLRNGLSDPMDPCLRSLNILIVITGEYFGQLEGLIIDDAPHATIARSS